jgi:flagellin-specific chaperone FliS
MLERFYLLARKRIVEAQAKQSIEMMEEISRDFLSVREAWAQIENQQAVSSNGKPHDAHVSCIA